VVTPVLPEVKLQPPGPPAEVPLGAAPRLRAAEATPPAPHRERVVVQETPASLCAGRRAVSKAFCEARVCLQSRFRTHPECNRPQPARSDPQ